MLLLGLRLISRSRKTGGALGLDDLFITIAWLCASANVACVLLFTYRYGLDSHIWDVPPTSYEKAAQLTWLIALLFTWSTAFTKVSVLLFYRRLVADTYSRTYKLAIWVAIAFIAVYTVVITILQCSTCIPLEANWRRLNPNYTRSYRCGSTASQTSISVMSGALSVISDFYSVLLPALLVFRIQVTKMQRLGLLIIFGMGSLVVIAGIVRTVYLGQVYSSNPDKTWLGFSVIVAGVVEGNLAILCACAPSLRSFFRNFFRDRWPTETSNPASSTEYSGSKFMHSPHLKGSRSTQSKTDWAMSPAYAEPKLDIKLEEPGVFDFGLGDPNPTVSKEFNQRVASPMLPLSWLDTAGEGTPSDSDSAHPPPFLDMTTDEEEDDEVTIWAQRNRNR